MINKPVAPLEALALFPLIYESERPFDPGLPYKNWADPNPTPTDFGGVQICFYPSFKIDPGSGKVVPFQFAIPLAQAVHENVPSKLWTGAPVKFTPVPCRNLETGESFRVGFGGIEVLNDKLYAELEARNPTSSSGFTQADREFMRSLKSVLAQPQAQKDYTAQLDRMELLLSRISIRLSIGSA